MKVEKFNDKTPQNPPQPSYSSLFEMKFFFIIWKKHRYPKENKNKI